METAAASLVTSHFPLKSFVVLIQALLWSAIIALTYRFLKTRKHSNTSKSIIPGPKTHLLNPFGIFGYIPSYSTMRRMSLPPSIYLAQLLNGLAVLYPNEKLISGSIAYQKFVVLLKHESLEEFMNSGVVQAKPFQNVIKTWFGNGLFASSGSKWKTRRKLINPVFHLNALKQFVSTFDEQSKILVDTLKRRHHEKWIAIEDPIALCSADIMGETVLGINLATQTGKESKFVDAMLSATRALAAYFVNPLYRIDMLFRISAVGRSYKRDTSYLQKFALEVIRQRKAARKMQQEGDGKFSESRSSKKRIFVDYLLDIHLNNPDFTEEDMKEDVVTLIFGGQDTTASAMTWVLYLLGLYPEIQNKVHEELDNIFQDDYDRSVTADDLKEMRYLECVLKETQRLYPAAPFNMREAPEDFQLCGYTIKKGTIIIFAPSQIHQNPEVFPDPERFDPNRFLPEHCVDRSAFAYIPFSAGPRTCMGRHFAMLELKTVIANVLRNFSVKSMEPRDKACAAPDLILRPVRPLKLQFTRRNT